MPSRAPTDAPSMKPSRQPSRLPSRVPSVIPTARPSAQPSDRPSAYPSDLPSSRPTINASVSPSKVESSIPSVSLEPTKLPTSSPSILPTNCPSTPTPNKCSIHVCVSSNNTNVALSGCGLSLYVSDRGNVQGPIDGSTDTSFGAGTTSPPYGSTYESTEDHVAHWWEVFLKGRYTIAQIKIFACVGPLCNPEGEKLDQIRVDIFDGTLVVSSFFFYSDQGPVLDLILPVEVVGQTVRVTKTQIGKVLSLSEVQIMGRAVV